MLRKIALKSFPAPAGSPANFEPITSILLLNAVITSPRQGGETLTSLRSGVKVLDAIDVVKSSGVTELFLDEESWDFLKQRIETMTWAVFDKVIIEFSDDVINAPMVDPNAASVAKAGQTIGGAALPSTVSS